MVVLPDNDQAGHDHARDVAASLQPAAKSVRVVALPGLPPKGDVSDWLTAGGSIEELTRLVAATAPAVKGDGAADIAQIEQLIEQAGADPGHRSRLKRSISSPRSAAATRPRTSAPVRG